MEFKASEAIRFGWETFKKRPWFFVLAAAVFFAVSWAASFVADSIFNDGIQDEWTTLDAANFAVNYLLSTLVGLGMTAFVLQAVAAPESAKLADLWHPRSYSKYLAASVLRDIIIAIGFILLIIPGVFLSIMLLFVPYLVVERGMGPIEAIKESTRMTRGVKWELLLLLVAVAAIAIAGALLLLVGLLAAIPVVFLAIARSYKVLAERSASAATL